MAKLFKKVKSFFKKAPLFSNPRGVLPIVGTAASVLFPGVGSALGGLLGKFGSAASGLLNSDRFQNLLGGVGGDGSDLLSLLPAAFLKGDTTGRDIFNLQRDVYGTGAPARARALELGTERLGRPNLPETFGRASQLSLERSRTPYTSAYDPEALRRLRESSLAEFDVGAGQEFDPFLERQIASGIFSGEAGAAERARQRQEFARKRSLLARGFDVEDLLRQEEGRRTAEEIGGRRVSELSGLGREQVGLEDLLGFQRPLSLLDFATEIPQFNVPEQDQTKALIAALLGESLGGLGRRRSRSLDLSSLLG